MKRLLESIQNYMLGYSRTSPKRHVFFYIAMLISLFSVSFYIYQNFSQMMDFHVIVATIGMIIGVGIIFLFDINSFLPLLFFMITLILPRFIFPFVNSFFKESEFANIAYLISSIMFLVFEFIGFILTSDIYDPSSIMLKINYVDFN